MPPVTIINNFLDRIVKKCLYIRIINGIYLFCALLTGGFLITNLVAYFAEDPKTYLSPIVFGIFIALGYILIRYLIQPLARGFSRENAAILVESLISGLNNSLINACQLQKKLEEPNAEKIVSLDFINKMLRETRQFIQDIQIDKLDHLLEKQKNFNNRNLFIIFLGMVLFASMILPDFFTLGYEKWITPPPRPEPVLFKTNVMQTKQQPASANLVSISDIRLKFNFPSYTQMSSETVDPSDGTVNVLPGTEIQIKAKSSQFLTHADLVINGKDRFALAVKQGRNLWGSFMAYEKGYYQFGVKSQEIARDLLNPKYSILLQNIVNLVKICCIFTTFYN